MYCRFPVINIFVEYFTRNKNIFILVRKILCQIVLHAVQSTLLFVSCAYIYDHVLAPNHCNRDIVIPTDSCFVDNVRYCKKKNGLYDCDIVVINMVLSYGLNFSRNYYREYHKSFVSKKNFIVGTRGFGG